MKLDNKNWTEEEAREYLGTRKLPIEDEKESKKKSKKNQNKRVFPKIGYGGLGVHRDNPIILKLGGYANKGII